MKIEAPDFEYRGKVSGIDFWLHKSCPVCSVLPGAVLSGTEGSEKVFKDDEKRCVCLSQGDCGRQVIIKSYRLPRLKDKLGSSRFAPQEVIGHLHALKSGISAPALLGFFERKNCIGVPTLNGLIIEYLANCRHPSATEIDYAVRFFPLIYNAGLHFPDMMRDNIMIEKTSGTSYLIDFEGCTVLSKPEISSVLMCLARYIEYNALGFEHEVTQKLIASVYDSLSLKDFSFSDFHMSLKILSQKHLKTRERIKLSLPESVRSILALNRKG